MEGLKVGGVFVVCLLIPTAVLNMWYWFTFFLLTGIILLVVEIISSKKRGETLSSYHWNSESKKKWLLPLGISLFFIYLVLHLTIGI